MKSIRVLPALIMSGIILMSAVGIESTAAGKKSDMQRRMARHFYLSAAGMEATGKSDAAAELYKKAYELDSTYSEAALQYGIRRLGMPFDTLRSEYELNISKNIARKFNDSYPGDIFPNILYSNVMERGNDLEESIRVLETLRKGNPSNSDLLQMLSSLYLDVGEYDKAMEAINAYQRAEGDNLELILRKAGMRLAIGDSVGALREAQEMVDKYPRNPQYLLLKSQLQAYTGQPDSALFTALAVEKMNTPGYEGPVKMHLAELYRSRGDSVNYDAKIYEAFMAEDITYEGKRDLLTQYLQNLIAGNGDGSRGDRLVNELIRQYPHEPELLALAARYMASKNEYDKALEEIDYAIDMDLTNSEYRDLAMMFAVLGDDKYAPERVLARVRQSFPNPSLTSFLLIGNHAMTEGDYDRALEYYREAAGIYFPGQDLNNYIDKDRIAPYLTMDNIGQLIALYQQTGDAFYHIKDREHAFINYENAIGIDPENALALNNYAYFLTEGDSEVSDDELQKADDMSKKAIEIFPENPTYLDTRAWVLFRKGEYQEAKEILLHAIEIEGENIDNESASEYYHHLGDILFRLGELDAALDAWKNALKGDNDNDTIKRKIKNKNI